jgi:PST family polysaccharide transporter
MARLLEPEHFGIFALAFFFVTVFDVRGKLGLDYAFIHRQPTTDQLIATHWALQTGAALITLLIVALASLVVANLKYPTVIVPIMLALAGALTVESAGTTARAALEKELVFARSTFVVTGALFLSYLIAIGLATQGYTYWALVGQVAVNAAFSSVGFWWAYRRLGHRPSIRFSFDRALAGWLLRFGATLALGSVATMLLLQFDNFLVGTFVGAAALGYYAQAYKVAQWPTGLVTHIVSRAALPTYAKLQNDPARLSKAFELTLWLILTLATPIALAIFVAAPDFLILLYGEKWLPSAILLRFLIVYSLLRPLLDDTGALFVAIGQPKRVTIVLTTQAALLILAATPLTLTLDAIGTALGVGVAFVAGIALTYRFVSQTIPIDLARVFAPAMIAAAASLAIYFGLTRLFDFNLLPLLACVLVKGGLAASIFFAFILVLERGALFDRVNYVRRLL